MIGPVGADRRDRGLLFEPRSLPRRGYALMGYACRPRTFPLGGGRSGRLHDGEQTWRDCWKWRRK
jgi:hypothetical protein